MASSRVRYGLGVTREIGHDVMNLKAKKVCVMTDSNVAYLPPVKTTIDSLAACNIKFDLFDRVRVEPTDARYISKKECMNKGSFFLLK